MNTTEEKMDIRNSQRKYQVFISSTFRDLADQRRMVLDVVVDRGHMPIALERLPAADITVPSVIEKTIEASQIYVVILGYRYGALVKGRGISFSQLEYEIAFKSGKVVVPFVLIDSAVKQHRTQLREDLERAKADITRLAVGCLEHNNLRDRIAELEAEFENEDKLEKFRATVTKDRFYKPFSFERSGSIKEFNERMVLEALIQAEEMAREKRIPGWIREPAEKELAETLAAVSRNRFLVDVVGAMAKFDRLDPRVRDHAEEKAAAASFFVDKYFQPLIEKNVGLFFESGSTVAYVAEAVGRRLGGEHITPLIATNNVLAFLIFWLVQRVQCSLFPWGPPEQQYGAVFGQLNNYVPEAKRPCFPPEPLNKGDKRAIELLNENPYSPAKWECQSLLLGALSGLQLTTKPEIANCLGPHVGSPRNKVFKRFMYGTRLPLMLFMTSDKIDSPVDTERCHFILDQRADQEVPWERFCNELPIAFCVGCKNVPEEISRTAYRFETLGLKIIRAEHKTSHTAFVARNQEFIDRFESVVPIC